MRIRLPRPGPGPAAAGASALAYAVVLPMLPALAAQLSPSPAAPLTGRLMAAYSVAAVMSAPLWAHWCDRHARTVLRIGLVGQAMALALALLPPSVASLLLMRTLQGAFAGAVLPALWAWASGEGLDEHQRSQRLADIARGGLVGGLFGPAVGGLLAGTTLAGPALAGMAVLVLGAVAAPHMPITADEGKPASPARRGALAFWLGLGALAAAAMSVYEVGLTTRGRLALGLSPRDIGWMFTGCGLVMLLAQTLVFRPGHDPVRAFAWVAPAFAATAVGLAVLTWRPSGWSLSMGVALTAASGGILQPALAYWTARAAGTATGATLGLRATVATAGQAAGSVVGGYAFAPSAGGRAALAGTLAVLAGATWISMRLNARLRARHHLTNTPTHSRP
ncbi:MAG: MFS transporter [Pseudomonadota bacterium]